MTKTAEATSTQEAQEASQNKIPYIGQGSYTPNMLSSWRSIEKKLLARGHTQEDLDYTFVTTICPKGHDEHMNHSAAAKKYFPAITPVTARNRMFNVLADFTQQLFSGQIVDECQAKWDEAHKKPEPKTKRPRLSLEEKAKKIAERDLKADFRESKNLGGRGRLKPEVQEELDRYLEKNLPNAIKKVTADLEKENAS